jgi:hypothetical protein
MLSGSRIALALETVLNSMKGQDESLIERAVLQARQEADLLYNLAVSVNVGVIENRVQREREYILSLGFIGAEWHGRTTEQSIEALRLAVLMFLESVIILDAAIAQVAVEHLNGQPLLFRDSASSWQNNSKWRQTYQRGSTS